MIYTEINSYNLRGVSYDNLTLLHPTYDYVFEELFSTDGQQDCLKSLLNSILQNNPTIHDLTLRSTWYKRSLQEIKNH